MSIPERKTLRQNLIHARESLGAELRDSLCSHIERHLVPLLEQINPTVLGFCWPYRGEADLREIVAHWLACDSKRRAALPVVTGADTPMSFRAWEPATPMVADRYGIPIPASGEFVEPEVVLVPINGFDLQGYRIGYGGGHFDRTLAAMRPRPISVGVGFELGRLASIAPEPHDLPLDWVVTDAGVVVRPAGL